MHEIFSPQPDPLEGMLRPPPLPPDGDALRQDLLARTGRVLRRRRRLRQLAWAGGLAACLGAGLLVARWRMMQPTTPAPPQVVQEKPKPAPEPETGPAPAEESAALAKEWEAVEGRGPRPELFRKAGDLYLNEENDLQSAVRCYGNSLSVGTDRDLEIAADDNWLLMAIKDAREKEKDHAKNGG